MHCYAVIEMHHTLVSWIDGFLMDFISVNLWSNWEKSREKQLYDLKLEFIILE